MITDNTVEEKAEAEEQRPWKNTNTKFVPWFEPDNNYADIPCGILECFYSPITFHFFMNAQGMLL